MRVDVRGVGWLYDSWRLKLELIWNLMNLAMDLECVRVLLDEV